ncbi:hypothetical protein [Mucilaginibacter celer]|uniref:Uncharacterized protein n=1 Tax=Mucilaginibacter celer TaxID=2305508 RepID=A0A494VZG2_9SPHI|nr:hypothetical protein [Mucilaginibacter celer]AYL96362.1 hypothetical protein HYN43_014125 [Mucilaginibacter celer]
MRGYVNIPGSIYCRSCRICGARPVIALAGDVGYVIKCPNNDNHYQTKPGAIDINDWNAHNSVYDCNMNGKAALAFH